MPRSPEATSERIIVSRTSSAVDSSFIAQNGTGNVAGIVKGAVARAPLVKGEPLSTTKIVHAQGAGFMAAQLSDGTRAVSIRISVESGAGGFILPNDRVDVLLTRKLPSGKAFATHTILDDVRVLAIDQTADERVTHAKVAKSVTLQVSTVEAQKLWLATSIGSLSLLLRQAGAKGDASAVAAATPARASAAPAGPTFRPDWTGPRLK